MILTLSLSLPRSPRRCKGGLIQLDLSNGNSNVVIENLSTECQRIQCYSVDVGKEAVALVLELTVPIGENEIVLTEEVLESVTVLLKGEKDTQAKKG